MNIGHAIVFLFIESVSFIRLMFPSADNGFIIRSHTTFRFKVPPLHCKHPIFIIYFILDLLLFY